MKRPALAVMGSVVADIVVQAPRLPRSGENMHVQRVQAMTGGKASNAAVAFCRLGGRAFLLGQTGTDVFGQQARRDLQAEGVDISALLRDPQTPTGAGILLVEPDGLTAFMIDPGANQTLKAADLQAVLPRVLAQVQGLLFNFESPAACLYEAMDRAQAQGLPIFVDAGPARPYPSELWQQATILSPNQPETEALVGYGIESDEAALTAAHDLLAQGPHAVVLKLGARGALWSTNDGHAFVPAQPIQLVDSAGAGDAFTAGLVLATLQGTPLPQAVAYANRCGAIAAARPGTMQAMPYRSEVGEPG